jgi:hypothetical protein
MMIVRLGGPSAARQEMIIRSARVGREKTIVLLKDQGGPLGRCRKNLRGALSDSTVVFCRYQHWIGQDRP